jgi:hypothetical protein
MPPAPAPSPLHILRWCSRWSPRWCRSSAASTSWSTTVGGWGEGACRARGLRLRRCPGASKARPSLACPLTCCFPMHPRLRRTASEQHVSSAGIEDVPPEQLERVMRTNVFGYVFMAKVWFCWGQGLGWRPAGWGPASCLPEPWGHPPAASSAGHARTAPYPSRAHVAALTPPFPAAAAARRAAPQAGRLHHQHRVGGGLPGHALHGALCHVQGRRAGADARAVGQPRRQGCVRRGPAAGGWDGGQGRHRR